MAKKKKNEKISEKRATTMFKNKLKSDTGIPAPKGYDSWVDYMMVRQEPPKPFRSWLEVKAYYWANNVIEAAYEPKKYPYSIRKEATYLPDLEIDHNGMTYWGEVKGRFKTMAEANKYLDIRKSHPDVIIFFILSKPGVSTPGAQVRKKCGTRRSMEEWCSSNGFEYTFADELEEYINENIVGY